MAPDESENIFVSQSSPNRFRVFLGSDRFKGVGMVERQKLVWDYLSPKLPPEVLDYCAAIHPHTVEEFENAYSSPEESSSSAVPQIMEED